MKRKSPEKRKSTRKSKAQTRPKQTTRLASDVKQETSVHSREVALLVAQRHPDPHRILGAHPTPAGIVVRAFRSDAERVEVIVGRKRAQVLEKIHPAGLFEILLPGLTSVPQYRLQVSALGRVSSFRDPYSFLPTLGDLDLHLFAEGRHEAIYEKLGSHAHKVGQATGVSFAVWAPQAEGGRGLRPAKSVKPSPPWGCWRPKGCGCSHRAAARYWLRLEPAWMSPDRKSVV